MPIEIKKLSIKILHEALHKSNNDGLQLTQTKRLSCQCKILKRESKPLFIF